MLIESLLVFTLAACPPAVTPPEVFTVPGKESLTGNLGQSKRRKMRNLRDTDLLTGSGSGAVDGGPVDPDDGGPGDGPGPAGPTGPGDCEGGLLGCAELAKGPFCSPDSSGAYEEQVGCVVDVATAQLSPGDTVAWAADLKLTSGTEVNPAGTLKMTSSGLLYRDALDSLDGVTIENGTAEILNGKLHLPDGTNNDVRFTGATTRNEVVAQIRLQGSMNPTNWILARFGARVTVTLDAYVGGYGKFQDALDRYVGGVFDAQLDTENYAGGAQRLSGERTVLKLYTADGVQKLKMSTDTSDQTYQMSAADTTHDTDTGVPALISSSTNQPTIAWDLIQCPNDVITCTSLPTGYAIRVGTLSATESSGTATLDIEGTLYPSSFPLEIIDDNGAVIEAWMPSAGFFGGATFEYSSTGSFAPDDVEGQIDLDIFGADGSLLQTATTGSTWDQPTYKRFSGTIQLPEGSAFLAPTMRRTGTDTGVVCSRLVVVRKGTSAPWVPCEEDAAETAEGRCGDLPIILNTDWAFTGPGFGDYWGTHPGSDGTADAETPTLAQIDFIFSGDNQAVFLYQVASPLQDLSKGIEPIRYVPVCPYQKITFAAEFVKESPTDGTGWDLIIREYDANKAQVGSAHSGLLQWTGSEDGGRKQLVYWIGQELDDDDAETVRYISLSFEADGDTGERSGMNYLQAWPGELDYGLSVILSLDGTNADFTWNARVPSRVKYVSSTTGFVDEAEVELNGSFTSANLNYTDTETDIETGLSSGNVVYLSAVPYDRDWRRSGKIVHQQIHVP